MKIQLLSDLHIEFGPYEYPACDCDVVVLAGDIHTKDRGVKWALDNIVDTPVIYVLGNHEFYGKTYQKLIIELKTLTAETNVHVLEKDSIIIDDVVFLGCTLWTDFELFGEPRVAGYQCQQVMTDYKKIKKLPNYSKIRSLDTATYHKHSMAWLEKELINKQEKKTIVVSHHGPSIKSAHPLKTEDITTAAYVSNLEDFILKHKPNLWLHGHLHNNSDYLIGDTRVVCNPRGYYPKELNIDFSPFRLIEI